MLIYFIQMNIYKMQRQVSTTRTILNLLYHMTGVIVKYLSKVDGTIQSVNIIYFRIINSKL